MPSIFGRAIIETPTNKSGGALAKGDVVVIDTANDYAVTTTTTGATTVTVGVVVEENGIASNATGRVQFGGYVGLVNVNASVTRGHYGVTHTVAKQATDGGASRIVGAFCVFLTGGTTPTAHLFVQPDGSSAAGNVATDPIWDAAGDTLVGTGANTGARLPIGAAGAAKSVVNGAVAWNSGTAFPTAATGDRYWRTDLGRECYYDGTRWLSVQVFDLQLADTAAAGADGALLGRVGVPFANAYDLWLIQADFMFRVDTTASGNNGSHYWTINVRSLIADNTATTRATTNTSALSADVSYDVAVAIGAAMGTTVRVFDFYPAKTGTPGSIVYLSASIKYRLIVT